MADDLLNDIPLEPPLIVLAIRALVFGAVHEASFTAIGNNMG